MKLWHGEATLTELGRAARWRVDLIGVVTAVVAAVALVSFGPSLRQLLSDALQRIMPSPQPSREVVIVAIYSPSRSWR